ncbi:hypothetical protein JB92DRAFT_3120433 [Gautieria morchelliformis]|nr:hypothetical protein JB92DRAFT_3120433 [Gautieria morchelliformis]
MRFDYFPFWPLKYISLQLYSLEVVMKEEVTQAARYEQQLTTLERNIASELRETREIIAAFKAKKALVHDHIRTSEQMEAVNVPGIGRESARTLEIVNDVEWKLPGIRSQLVEIRKVYDLGRRRAQRLQAEMEWKAKTDFQQWRSTLLGKSPLSSQQVKREWLKLLWRFFFVMLALVALMYFVWTFRRG